MQRAATYWHMLPEAAQARKAIWDAVNPHTGKRRIDEAFPKEIRANVNDQAMFIRFKNGSSWQVVGSDNYNSLVGSPPVGVVYSEWALANPSARAYLRPIMMENKGWQLFITTPRGKNHAYNTYLSGVKNPGTFSQILTAEMTGIFTAEQLEAERKAYIDDFGDDMGNALFEQEYMCSFEAAIMGAFYARELADARNEGRIGNFPVDPNFPVETAWDIGRTDDTSIWFYQSTFDGIRVVDFHSSSLKDIDFYIDLLRSKSYKVKWLVLPHDAKAKRLGMKRTVEEQLFDAGFKVRTLPALSVQDGIQAARKTFKVCHFHEELCIDGLNALSQYRREWDDNKKCFKTSPLHDWTSHACLTGETLIKCVDGDKQIKDVVEGDKVLIGHLTGLVTKAGMVKYDKVLKITFNDGTYIRATRGHKFLTNVGLVCADALRYNSVLFTDEVIPKCIILEKMGARKYINMNARNLMVDVITSAQRGDISIRDTQIVNFFIGLFGNTITGLFQKATKYITKTTIRPTTTNLICSASAPAITQEFMHTQVAGLDQKQINSNYEKLWRSLKSGTNQEKEEIGILSTEKERGKKGSITKRIVYFVKSLTKLHIQTNRSSAIKIVKQITEDGVYPVFDLTVSHHHAYVANGVLVSNSDAFRYLSLAWMEKKPTPETKEPIRGHNQMTLNELFKLQAKHKRRRI